tara:strand:+ start:2841 stop:3551 length:711 start_codon:yes stop_codon:yes gene_type:complete
MFRKPKKIRIRLRQPVPRENIDEIMSEVDEQLKNEGVRHSVKNSITVLGGVTWKGPGEEIKRLIEVYEFLVIPREFSEWRRPRKILDTFYGTTEWTDVDSIDRLDKSWASELKEKGLYKTRAYVIEQATNAKDTMYHYWNPLDRNVGASSHDLKINGKWITKRIYSAVPFGEPVDWFGYPHPQEWGYRSTAEKGYLEKSLRQKENARKHLEEVFGRQITIRESYLDVMLKTIYGKL